MNHHAYLYEGPLALLPALGKDARARFGMGEKSNPDAHEEVWQKFGIDEARALVKNYRINSMIDVSDGLHLDLGRILQ